MTISARRTRVFSKGPVTTPARGAGATSPATRRATPSLAAEFNPRANSLDVLRLVLATTVALVHSSAIAYGHQPEFGATQVGALAVDAFFVLSGFLVTRSLLRLDSVWRYAWHRFLRILPLFYLVLFLTAFVVAPVVAWLEGQGPASAFAGPDPAWTYITNNALLYIAPDNFGVAGLPAGTQQPGVINGALWTLFYEAVCYVLVAVLGIVGLLGRRRWAVPALAGLWWAALVLAELGVRIPGPIFHRFFFVFLLGTTAYLYADRIPVRGRWALASVVVLMTSFAVLDDYRILGGVAFAYLCLYAVVRTPWLRWRLRADLSYGMYVFHWPVETMLVLAGATALTQVGYTALAIALTAALAWASWTFLERPCLSRKQAFMPRAR